MGSGVDGPDLTKVLCLVSFIPVGTAAAAEDDGWSAEETGEAEWLLLL